MLSSSASLIIGFTNMIDITGHISNTLCCITHAHHGTCVFCFQVLPELNFTLSYFHITAWHRLIDSIFITTT